MSPWDKYPLCAILCLDYKPGSAKCTGLVQELDMLERVMQDGCTISSPMVGFTYESL